MAKGTCLIEGCEKMVHGRGWCDTHYQRWKFHGDPVYLVPRPTLEERFWSKVEKTDGCWVWGSGNDYGQISVNGKPRPAHCVSWVLHFGPIPRGLFVCHSCDNPPCVRPDHLWLGTHKDNMRDKLIKGRLVNGNTFKTYCDHGHPFDEVNTIIRTRDGRACRECRACHREASRRLRARRAAV